MIYRSSKQENLSGFASIVSSMARESKQGSFGNNEYLKQCLISQWFDYAVLFVAPAVHSKTASEAILHELNDYLLSRSYLVGQNLTLADVVIFYAIYNIVVSKTYLNIHLHFNEQNIINENFFHYFILEFSFVNNKRIFSKCIQMVQSFTIQ